MLNGLLLQILVSVLGHNGCIFNQKHAKNEDVIGEYVDFDKGVQIHGLKHYYQGIDNWCCVDQENDESDSAKFVTITTDG